MCFFFFKQKTAYEMAQCDWSSDVCSSDLELRALLCDRQIAHGDVPAPLPESRHEFVLGHGDDRDVHPDVPGLEPSVEVPLEDLADLVDQAALDPSVDEVEG